MGTTHIQTPPKWRTLLILGRASNVPTVWSNCLAGWLIGGMTEYAVLLWLCLGGTLLHIGGMYLNDAFDVGFDRRFRQERPIPAGHIEERTVWVIGSGAISGGFLCLVLGANVSTIIGLLLVASILLYDALHKHVSFSPVIMASCRFFLILAAFDSSGNPWQGFALWTAFAMAAYIVGLTYVARRESTGGGIATWPCLFIAAPIGLSFLLNNGRFFWMGLMVSFVLLAWVVWCLQFILLSKNVQIYKTVSGLLAGIPLVDMIAIVGMDPLWMGVMLMLFLAALFFQRFIPAT